MGRAGRSGTAYSLICQDEMPFVYDLHLFLGRPVQFATPDHAHGRLLRMVADGSAVASFAATDPFPTFLPQIQRACLVGSLRVSWMTKALISLRFMKTLWTFRICTGFLKMPTSSTLSPAQTPPLSPSDGSKARIHPLWLSILS